jgi:hypothetical protein
MIVVNERDALRKILNKMIKRGRFDDGIKTCKTCGKEYNEKENFNWSCRTHRSEWGGEMWWCCGKRGLDQPGCKYSKHETKNDEEATKYLKSIHADVDSDLLNLIK